METGAGKPDYRRDAETQREYKYIKVLTGILKFKNVIAADAGIHEHSG